MAYTLSYSLALGPAYAATSDLRAQLVDTSGANVGSAISTGFTIIGTGYHLWNYANMPDDHRGGVKFYSNAASSVVLGFLSVNPQEAEYSDAKTSLRPTVAQIETQLSGVHGSGSWATATGFATPTNVSDVQLAITAAISALNNVSTTDLTTALTNYDGATGADLTTTQNAIAAAIAALNNLSQVQVQTAAADALTAYDPPTKAELDTAQTAIIAAIPSADDAAAAVMAYALESGKTVAVAMLDIWAVIVGDSVADDADDPTEIAYDSPDGTVQITHELTDTTRTNA
jgi:hypothetical protein